MMSNLRTPRADSPRFKSSSLDTPRTRRRLSMNDSGASFSLNDSGMSDENGSQDYEFADRISEKLSFSSKSRAPLREVDPNVQENLFLTDKENVPPSFSCHYRPASLPALVSQDRGTAPKARKNLYSQISSPMSRMSLMSPGGSLGSELSSSRPSSATSDGFFPVFDQMEEPLPSPAVSSLISAAPFPPPMTNKCSENNNVARPTPIRPQLDPDNADGARRGTGVRRGSLKRSSPMSQPEPVHHKRRCPLPFSPKGSSPSTFLRSQSCCVPCASSISPNSPIGDVSKKYALPLVKKSVSDLKYISPDTLNSLLDGHFKDTVDRYTILDCRFPYEYEGGHIRGAKNIWTQDGLMETMFPGPLQHPEEGHREIFIFHCEFSSKRGPKMSRFLRKIDREKNGMSFPKLYYPELYLLDGGYKAFFEKHPGVCVPQGYCCMEDENHLEELKKCKVRSQSWHGDQTVKRHASRQKSKSSNNY